MRTTHRARLARTIAVLLVLVAGSAPVASFAHAASHVAEQSVAPDASSTADWPLSGTQSDADCDVCDLLASGRAVVATSFAPAWSAPMDPGRALPCGSLEGPIRLHRAPASPRAPPLS